MRRDTVQLSSYYSNDDFYIPYLSFLFIVLLILRRNARTTDDILGILTSLVADVIILVSLHKMTFGNVTAKPQNWRKLG